MNDLQLRTARAANTEGALYLQFRIRAQRFALSVHEVIEVLPRQPLKPIAQAPAWVAGILAHRGQLVPVIDLAALSFGQPAVQRTSTRLVLVHYRGGLQLGLILEQATETLRCQPDEFQPYGVDTGDAPYLGPVRQDAQGLPDTVHALLYTQDPTGMPT